MAKLTLKQIKDYHDKGFTNNQTTRIEVADSILFANVTQWDSSLLENSQLGYKGQFDILRKARRQIMSDLKTNQVQVDFEPTEDGHEDKAELINGIFLAVDRENTSIEAYENASQECVDGGLGGWELFAAYESDNEGERHQKIHRRPLHEFNNNWFPDPNAKLLDKSDADYWSGLIPFSMDGYKKIYKELTGEETDCAPENFAAPECSYVFPWVTGNELYYLVKFYHKSEVKDAILAFTDPFGEMVKYRESDLQGRGEDGDIDLLAELKANGYKQVNRKQIKRTKITLYIASGEAILKTYDIPCDFIPVIPTYGERAFVEGEEHYEGITKLAKDPQRLRNFTLSYLGDILSRSPREKPIFLPEQLSGHTNMYDINGAENNFPFLYQNRKDASGNELPLGPVGTLPAPQMPPALGPVLELTRQAVEDVANPGLPRDVLDSDMSGEAIGKLQARLDNQSHIFQEHLKHAKRFDAVVFASMAARVYDSPRKIMTVLPDGTRKLQQIMQTTIDKETGEPVVLNDLTNSKFEVYAHLGPSYDSNREKTFDRLGAMAQGMGTTDPNMAKLIMLKQLTLVPGIDTKDIREYAKKQLMLAGVVEPDTDEEKQWLADVQNQPKQPDPAMLEGQANMLKGQAALLKEQRIAHHEEQTTQLAVQKQDIDRYQAQTDRIKAMHDVVANHTLNQARIHLTRAQAASHHIDNIQKLTEPYRARISV